MPCHAVLCLFFSTDLGGSWTQRFLYLVGSHLLSYCRPPAAMLGGSETVPGGLAAEQGAEGRGWCIPLCHQETALAGGGVMA